jgi:hypothetical protein
MTEHLVAAVQREYRKLGRAGAGERAQRVYVLDRLILCLSGNIGCPIGRL